MCSLKGGDFLKNLQKGHMTVWKMLLVEIKNGAQNQTFSNKICNSIVYNIDINIQI